MDTDLYLSEVFVDNGKAKSDGFDQRGTVRVVQKPAYYGQVRYGSVVQDWDQLAAVSVSDEPQSGITSGPASSPTGMSYGMESTEKLDHPKQEASINKSSPIQSATMEQSLDAPDFLDEWEYSEEEIAKPGEDDWEANQNSGSWANKGKNVSFAHDSDVDMVDSASHEEKVSMQDEVEKPGNGVSRIKPFRETEEEFQRSRSATASPEKPKQLPDSPFKGLLAAQRKRKQSEPPQSRSKKWKTSDNHENVSGSDESDFIQSSFQVEVPPVKGITKIEDSPDGPLKDIPDTPRTSNKNRDVMPSGRGKNPGEMANALSPPEASPSIKERRHSKVQKIKDTSSKDFVSSPLRFSQDKETPTKTNGKPVPPDRPGSKSDCPPCYTMKEWNKLRDNGAKRTKLEEAEQDGAKEDHLAQIETVYQAISKYHDAVEAGRRKKKIEKLRAKWEHENDILEKKAAETAKNKEEYQSQEALRKAEKTLRASSQPRTSTGQFAKQSSPSTPQPKLGVSPRSVSKPAISSQKKSDSAMKPETPKSTGTGNKAKENTSSKSDIARSRARSRAVSTSSSDYEENDRESSSDVPIAHTRRHKRLRRTK